jgi:hypothetical protein
MTPDPLVSAKPASKSELDVEVGMAGVEADAVAFRAY